ncbi:hypothetical protein C6W92_04975 [Roseovarius sp. A46]|mgnify:CR=1 FL=1|jgi:uncharacterized protein (DUF427 family)|uniref:DUF427 domain-containing protein n=1 Tax=Roseovarius sp. A46 TaxID=2109331 RepID=UPI000E97FF75|nr:DUF427 domain-containing protein [Roseovarius sp. A46]RXV66246.1 hypothetical protein C6W92_04975 [Roseovarius sp. A46]HAW47265.1 hypothetical protein [Roseovarius sp.]
MNKITIRKADGTWTVRAGGAILAESRNALELTEGEYPAVIYFPREDIAMAFLDESEQTSHCPFKGDARYFSIETKSQTIENAAWSYEAPKPEAVRIAGHIAFYTTDKVAVERI